MIRSLQSHDDCLNYPVQNFQNGNILASISNESIAIISDLTASSLREKICLRGHVDLHNIELGFCGDVKRNLPYTLQATNSAIAHSEICDSQITDSSVENSVLSDSVIIKSVVSNSAMTNALIFNSRVNNSIFNDKVDLENVNLHRVVFDEILMQPTAQTTVECVSARFFEIDYHFPFTSIGSCDDPIICQGDLTLLVDDSPIPETLNSTTIKTYCFIDENFKPYPIPSEIIPFRPTPHSSDASSKSSYPTIIRTLGISTVAIALVILIIKRCKRTDSTQTQEHRPISAETEMVPLTT